MKRKRKTRKNIGGGAGGGVNDVPSSVRIGYADYSIVALPHNEAELRDPYGISGQIQHDKHIIDFDEDLNPVALANTLLHECLHGIVEMQGLKFRREDEEEKLVTALSNGLTSLIRDNPEFMKFIIRVLK